MLSIPRPLSQLVHMGFCATGEDLVSLLSWVKSIFLFGFLDRAAATSIPEWNFCVFFFFSLVCREQQLMGFSFNLLLKIQHLDYGSAFA